MDLRFKQRVISRNNLIQYTRDIQPIIERVREKLKETGHNTEDLAKKNDKSWFGINMAPHCGNVNEELHQFSDEDLKKVDEEIYDHLTELKRVIDNLGRNNFSLKTALKTQTNTLYGIFVRQSNEYITQTKICEVDISAIEDRVSALSLNDYADLTDRTNAYQLEKEHFDRAHQNHHKLEADSIALRLNMETIEDDLNQEQKRVISAKLTELEQHLGSIDAKQESTKVILNQQMLKIQNETVKDRNEEQENKGWDKRTLRILMTILFGSGGTGGLLYAFLMWRNKKVENSNNSWSIFNLNKA